MQIEKCVLCFTAIVHKMLPPGFCCIVLFAQCCTQCVNARYWDPDKTNIGNNGMYQHIMQDLFSAQSLNLTTLPKLHMAQRLAQFQLLLYSSLGVYVILHFITAIYPNRFRALI